jgi:hypothetical protein
MDAKKLDSFNYFIFYLYFGYIWWSKGINILNLIKTQLLLIFFKNKFKLMSSRKPFALDQALFWWNLFLATFSAIGAARMLPELFWFFLN